MGKINREGQKDTPQDKQIYEDYMIIIRPYVAEVSRLVNRNLRLYKRNLIIIHLGFFSQKPDPYL